MKKPYECTEVQGRGRRYWFPTEDAAEAFLKAKEAKGHHGFTEGRSCWVSFARRRTPHVYQVVAAGIDPLAL